MRVHALLLVSILALVSPTTAQTPKPAPKAAPAAKPSTNATTSDVDGVIELAKGGMSDALIIKSIQNSGKVYKLAPPDLLRVKKGGVSDAVIEAMLDTASPKASSAPARSPSPAPATPAPGRAAAPAPASPGDREPTEAEMYAALKAGYDGTNAYMKEQEEACRSGAFRTNNDPAMAMMCLAGALGTNGQGGIGVNISGFRKIACAKATSVAGWNCDYVANINTTGLVSSPMLQGLMQNQVLQGRFLYAGGQWVKMPD